MHGGTDKEKESVAVSLEGAVYALLGFILGLVKQCTLLECIGCIRR